MELLELVESGELLQTTVLEAQVDRMMQDTRFDNGIRNFFDEFLPMYKLDSLTKDPLVFTHASPDLYASAKEETFQTIEHIPDNDIDFRELPLHKHPLWTDGWHRSTVYLRLCQMDSVRHTHKTKWRRGLLTQASMLNLHAHATASLPTLRGVFIRKTLLCQVVPLSTSPMWILIPPLRAEEASHHGETRTTLEDPLVRDVTK